MLNTLKIEILDQDPFVILTLRGTLSGVNVYELKHEGNRLIEYLGRLYVILNMKDIDFIDSGGIGVIVHFFQSCKKMGGRLAVVTPADEKAAWPMHQASLQRFVDFHPSLGGALLGISERCGINIPPALRGLCEQAGTTPPAPVAVPDPAPVPASLEQRLAALEERVRLLEAQLQERAQV